MAERSRDETGRYTGEVTDDDVVAAVRAHDPAATSEIGDELGVSRQAADRRLRNLRDDGRVSSKKIGASLVWFLPREAGARPTHAAETPEMDDGLPRDAGPSVRRYSRAASAREIVAAVMPEHSLGYDVPELEPGDRYRGAWWRRVVRPGLQRLDDVTHRQNHNDYAYAGDDT